MILHWLGHILSLFINPNRKYASLLTAFPTLYKEVCEINADGLLQTTTQVFRYLTNDLFNTTLPKQHILQPVNVSIQQYPQKINKILKIILSKLAEGFSNQQGAMFGFGPKGKEWGTLLKVSEVDETKK